MARRAAERYLDVVTRGDRATARRLTSCRIPDGAFRGANLLSAGLLDSLPVTRLDSLAVDARALAAAAAVELSRADEISAESLWARADGTARRARLLSDAQRAASMSRRLRNAPLPGDSILTFYRFHIRVRWGGPRVGPEPVDREHILRLVRANGGSWIVFSMLTRDLDPGPFLLRPGPPIGRSRLDLTAAGK